MLGFITAAVLALAGVGAYFVITRFDAAEPFRITGTMTLYAAGDAAGRGCRGTGGYGDVGPGTAVTVSDESGTLLAKTVLGSGDGGDGYCTFPISITDVPSGKKFYRVEVAHRGEVNFTETEARAGISLQLGNEPEISKRADTPTGPAASPRTPAARPPTALPPPRAVALPPSRSGMVYIVTRSGRTRCQIMNDEVDCQARFTNSPSVQGSPANGVRFMADGTFEWIVGDLGDIPVVPLEYQNYRALDWIIVATKDGTTFTHSRTGRSLFVSIDRVSTR
ncbi:hypothetical protein [Mycobacterium sp. ACS4331]|uniref:hypothetical protein n=1 Tax=Mycobacterium sp. ACS4331 TaxID=1834121 RepID=UPI0007FD9B84|nr:hypothetical protein [Mycobacterium sp. ACS4331]OBF21550.1 hypothetical protein A5727_08720 [Mycobacterium sp. ACS4331]